MHVPIPVRIALVVIAFLSLFWLPWIVTLFFIFLAGLVFPPFAFAFGIVADFLYYPGHGMLWGSFEGLLLMLISAAVRHFVKTRII